MLPDFINGYANEWTLAVAVVDLGFGIRGTERGHAVRENRAGSP